MDCGQLRELGAQPLHPAGVRRQRYEVGLGEVAVVGCLLLAAAGASAAGRLGEMPRLLHDPVSGVQDGRLPDHLRAHRPLDAPQRVHVLGLGADAPRLTRGIERSVDVAPQRPLLHAHVAHIERAQDLAQLGDIGPRYLGRARSGAGHRLGDDLDQRDAGTVVVDERVIGAVDAPALTDVRVLAGVLLEVHPLDTDPVGAASELDVEVAVNAERLVILRDLEVLRHVRVEVVLPGEPAPRGDRAIQRQADADGRLDRGLVGDGQRARQAETHRADLGVRLGAEGGRARSRTSSTRSTARHAFPGR